MRWNWSNRKSRIWRLTALVLALGLVMTACGDDDEGSDTTGAGGDTATTAAGGDTATTAAGGERSINVAIVGNPQMEDIASLTPELFTAETGIAVEYTILEEQTLREIVTRDVGASGEQFDVVMIGMYEAPQFGEFGWLYDLDQWALDDADYDKADIIPAVASGLSTDNGYWASPINSSGDITSASRSAPERHLAARLGTRTI